MRRFLVDTNVLLDACFEPAGRCASALEALQRNRSVLYTSDHILDEARVRIQRLCIASGVPVTPMTEMFEKFVASLRVVCLPPVPSDNDGKFHRSDRPIAALAKRHRVTLFTTDIALALKCISEGICVDVPWSIVGEEADYALQPTRAETQQDGFLLVTGVIP